MKINKKDMEKIADIFNRNFGEPFLKEGTVTVEVMSKTEYETYEKPEIEDPKEEYILSFNIGRRDIQIDSNFNVISSGTMLGSPDEEDEITEATKIT